MDLSENEIQVRDKVVEVIEDFITNHKKLNLSPLDIISFAKALFVLSRYPKVTIEGYLDISSSTRWPNGGLSYTSLVLNSDSFELNIGGSEYTEGIGGDSFTTLFYTSGCEDYIDFDGLNLWEGSLLSNIDENGEGLMIEDESVK